MVASVELTRLALGTGDSSQVWQFLGLLAAFDVMVAVAAVALYGFVIEE
jgi:hypothetical protein